MSDEAMTARAQGISMDEAEAAFSQFRSRVATAVSRAAETDDAIAELRRVCSGDRRPKEWLSGKAPPLPPPDVEYEELGQRARNIIGTPSCDRYTPRPWTLRERLSVAIPVLAFLASVALLVYEMLTR